MGKIIKNNVTYGGVPDEVITAWETEDVQDLSEIEYGDADISGIGDGSITGAIAEHESDISELNSNSTGTITASVTGGTLDSMRCRKVGNTVFASARLYNINATASGAFFNIPSGFRPSVSTFVMGYIVINNVPAPLLVEISPNGNVNFGYSSSLTTSQVGFAGCFTMK